LQEGYFVISKIHWKRILVGTYCPTELKDLQEHSRGKQRDPLNRTNIIPTPSFYDQSLLRAGVYFLCCIMFDFGSHKMSVIDDAKRLQLDRDGDFSQQTSYAPGNTPFHLGFV